jgi:hypothetical protein
MKRFDRIVSFYLRTFETCPLLPNPVKHLRPPRRQGATGAKWRGAIAPQMADGGNSGGPHTAASGVKCCRACTAAAPRSTVRFKLIEGACAKAGARYEGAPLGVARALYEGAPLGVARLHVLPCLHSREHGSALHRSPQAHPRGPVCEGAPPPRRAPTPRSFGRPATFVCRSPGQRPTHSLKGSVSEAPAHASVLLGGACGGGGLNRVRLPLARAAAWKDVGGPMSKYGPQNSWLFCSLNNITDGVTACADLVLQTT